MRKTVTVETVKNKINRMLAVPTRNLPTDQKQVLCSLLEEVLTETDNYRGFGWPNLTAEQARNIEHGHAEFYSRRYF